ncbi:hypothetical protein VDG09_21270 [Xanthomonas campestris pv. raphani]|uniref:hypothetical protein n=1 Tax=Xanthomonas campestris TaxID=339 RepID=UPI0023E9DDC6|nr:hypothetical protein [Xanthomonas campestris]MCW2038784.1 hypothetical protein [Xanthomonas campestris]MEA9830133.1 hypothetical protein [Xanthomonas campestris pv. raphani]
MSMISKYHGTSRQVAKDLQQGKIDHTLGGGELGQGFYLGDLLWVAKAWAHNRHGNDSSVLKVDVPDPSFNALAIELLSRTEALTLRKDIKAKNATRTYMHGFDVLWSPIVGTTRVEADQYKYESQDGTDLLNGTLCTRSLV